MEGINNYLNKLGYKATDVVTGFVGVIESMSIDLYGCVQYLLRAPCDKNVEQTSYWYDTSRIKITGKVKVMKPVGFDGDLIKGPANKPIP